ncbi:MAG: hypothetical protein RLP44_01975 [Aggregatilineales bacterium]
MAHNVNWYIENRIIYFHVYGDVSTSELSEINTKIDACLDVGHAPVHLIVNDSDTDKMPANIRELKKNLTFMSHPNIGIAVGVGEVNPVLRFLLPIVVKMAGINYVRRHTIAEALDYIRQYDPAIDWQYVDDGVLLRDR